MAELADVQDLKSCDFGHIGSNPLERAISKLLKPYKYYMNNKQNTDLDFIANIVKFLQNQLKSVIQKNQKKEIEEKLKELMESYPEVFI